MRAIRRGSRWPATSVFSATRRRWWSRHSRLFRSRPAFPLPWHIPADLGFGVVSGIADFAATLGYYGLIRQMGTSCGFDLNTTSSHRNVRHLRNASRPSRSHNSVVTGGRIIYALRELRRICSLARRPHPRHPTRKRPAGFLRSIPSLGPHAMLVTLRSARHVTGLRSV